jgi:phosphoglycolate phosphatase-like HAD superfamily hydrolase
VRERWSEPELLSLRRHLVWDWNGTLLDDLPVVIAATNAALASVGGPAITEEQHRREFRRPIADYYTGVLGRPVDDLEFNQLDKIFHDVYEAGLSGAVLTADAAAALRSWPHPQSLLSMWFHDELLLAVQGHGLTGMFTRIDGRRARLGGAVDRKGPYLADHLAALRLDGAEVVLVGDTVDDAHAAASAGAACVLYAGGFTEPALLRVTGVPVAGTLLEAIALAGSA